MAKPTKSNKIEFERVPKYKEWIDGIISEIEYDDKHEMVYQGEKKIASCVRFKFALKGCEFPHRSKWMTFSYSEKSNLYKRFIKELVEDAEPDMDFDLDSLKGFEIKTMWSQDESYDNLDMVCPLGKKLEQQPEGSKE